MNFRFVNFLFELISIEKEFIEKADKVYGTIRGNALKETGNPVTKVTSCAQFMVSNFLIDALSEFGFFFESTYGFRHRIVQYEMIEKIFYKGKLLFTKNEIRSYGKKLNDYFIYLIFI